MTEPFEPHSPEDDEEFSEEELRLARQLAEALDDPRARAGDVEPLLETASLVRGKGAFDLGAARQSEIRAALGREWEKKEEGATESQPRGAGAGRVIRLLRLSAVPIALAAAVLFSIRGKQSAPERSAGEASVAVRTVDEDEILFPEPPAALVRAQAAVIAESAAPERFAARSAVALKQAEPLDQKASADAQAAAAPADVRAEKKDEGAVALEARRDLDRELALYRRRLLASWEKGAP